MNQKSNMYNFEEEATHLSLASSLTENVIKARNQQYQAAFRPFEGVEHRLEYVKTIRGVDFVNDSKATSANALWYALQRMNKPVTWIMNIGDLDVITEELMEVINSKVKKIVIQGVYSSEVIDFFTGLQMDVSFAMNLEDAVRIAFYSSEQGNVILYAPGEMDTIFQSPFEKGTKFKQAIAQL